MKRVVTRCASPGFTLSDTLWVRTLCITFLLSGCTHAQIVDHPRTIEVKVPVVQQVPSGLVQDCMPAALAGPTVGAVLDRLAAVEVCLSQMREQAGKLRAAQVP